MKVPEVVIARSGGLPQSVISCPFYFIYFSDLLSQFFMSFWGVKGPQVTSSHLDFVDIAAQREDDLSQFQFHLPKVGSFWVSGPFWDQSPMATWASYGAEGYGASARHPYERLGKCKDRPGRQPIRYSLNSYNSLSTF